MEVGLISQGGQQDISVQSSYQGQIDSTQAVSSSKQIVQAQDTIQLSRSSNVGDTATTSEEKVKEIKSAVDKINTFLADNKTHAVFLAHDKFKNDIVVTIVDDTTGEVIQELPPRKILDMVAKMCEIVGVLFDKKA